MEFIDLALTFGMLDLPHPLLGHNVDFGGVGGRSALFEIDHRAPGENDHEDKERDGAPSDFERDRTFNLFGGNAGAVTVAGGEKDYQGADQQGHHPGDDEQKNVERVHAMSQGRGLLRP